MATRKEDDGDKVVGVATLPVGPPEPEYDHNGRLTRKGMETVLANGGSVTIARHNEAGAMIGHAHITSTDQLPSEAQLAKGDAAREAAVRENLMRQRKALDDQIAGLGVPAKAEK